MIIDHQRVLKQIIQTVLQSRKSKLSLVKRYFHGFMAILVLGNGFDQLNKATYDTRRRHGKLKQFCNNRG